MGGRLYVQGIPEGGPWDASHLVYWGSNHVDKGYHPLAGLPAPQRSAVVSGRPQSGGF
jgi:hypothetical protein